MAESIERKIRRADLQEAQEKLRSLANRAEGIIDSLRIATYVSPQAQVWDLSREKIADYARELDSVLAEGRNINLAIEKLKGELGLP